MQNLRIDNYVTYFVPINRRQIGKKIGNKETMSRKFNDNLSINISLNGVQVDPRVRIFSRFTYKKLN